MTRVAAGEAVSTLRARGARADARVGKLPHLALIAAAAIVVVELGWAVNFPIGIGADSWGYARAWAGPLYDPGAIVGQATFLYSPVFAQVIWPLTLIGAEPFVFLAMYAAGVAYVWLLWPLPLALRIVAIAACALPVWVANVEWIVAVTVVLAFRRPALWFAVVLTKPTMVAWLPWYVVRREWRPLLVALVTLAAIVLVSATLAPHLWLDWFAVLIRSSGVQHTWMADVPWQGRLVGGIILVIWGARTDRPWTVPIALVLAQPGWFPWTFGVLAAVPRLRRYS